MDALLFSDDFFVSAFVIVMIFACRRGVASFGLVAAAKKYSAMWSDSAENNATSSLAPQGYN